MSELYYPVLKNKRTSFFAVRDLKKETKTKILPIFEIIPEEEINPKKIVSNLKLYLPEKMTVMLDFVYLDNGDNNVGDIISETMNYCKEENINAIPMTGIGRSEEYTRAISLIVKDLSIDDIAIRIPLALVTPDINISDVLNRIIVNMELSPDKLRLFLDMEDIDRNVYFYAAEKVLSEIANSQYKSIGILAGAFPSSEKLKDLKGDFREVERFDYTIWKLLKKIDKQFVENLAYGDYTTRDVDLPYNGIPRHIVPVLRYTKADYYYIWRGFSSVNHERGMHQFNDACAILCQQPFFRGKDFSAGDRMIFEKANDPDSSAGNQATWAQIGINQHIEFVVSQISNSDVF